MRNADLKTPVNEEVLGRAVAHCREHGILLPTFAQMRDPDGVPTTITDRLRRIGLWDVDPANLFRITWKNEPVERGGLYGDGNRLEFPQELTGVPARLVGLAGRFFPTGAHKVGAAYGCLAPRLVTGAFDPTRQKAVWPSTGNYCRGGAFDSAVLHCKAVAILPEGMSRERFEWLRSIGTDEVIATPGCESNVKEIYDECHRLQRERGDGVVIFNQFAEFGNAAWHYHCTGSAAADAFAAGSRPGDRLAGFVSATGSAGTIAAGNYLKDIFPGARTVAVEALQCPTLLQNGFGDHRIEGIGDKHVPWIHDVRSTDMVVAVDDDRCLALIRLFNEEEGRRLLRDEGVSAAVVDRLDLLGISSACNLLAAIQAAKYWELESRDCLVFPMTDSMALYGSRIEELRDERGPYTRERAGRDLSRHLHGIGIDHLRELTYPDRKALHNLKYFTWVEQQGKSADELRALWDPDFWSAQWARADAWDERIEEFNRATGLVG